jgi:proteasome lid subunit RPN8/RPN11
MSPFEIRLELLKMAQTMLETDYYGKREQIANQYASDVDAAKARGENAPTHPGYPPYPSENDIITKAKTLNEFVSNTIPEPVKVTKKQSA